MKWDRKTAFEAAALCRDRRELMQVFRGADKFLRRNNLIDEALPRRTRQWDADSVRAVASRCRNAREFCLRHPGAYKAGKRIRLLGSLRYAGRFKGHQMTHKPPLAHIDAGACWNLWKASLAAHAHAAAGNGSATNAVRARSREYLRSEEGRAHAEMVGLDPEKLARWAASL